MTSILESFSDAAYLEAGLHRLVALNPLLVDQTIRVAHYDWVKVEGPYQSITGDPEGIPLPKFYKSEFPTNPLPLDVKYREEGAEFPRLAEYHEEWQPDVVTGFIDPWRIPTEFDRLFKDERALHLGLLIEFPEEYRGDITEAEV